MKTDNESVVRFLKYAQIRMDRGDYIHARDLIDAAIAFIESRCKNCGAGFVPKSHNQKFCKYQCKREAKKMKAKIAIAVLALAALTFQGCNHEKVAVAPRTIAANSVEFSDVAAAVAQANDGDTVQIPTGTAYWNSLLSISKAITIRGTTTVQGGGTKTPIVADGTLITDVNSAPNPNSGVFKTTTASSHLVQLIGISIVKGAGATEASGMMSIGGGGAAGPAIARISQCHLKGFTTRAIWTSGWVTGVADSNLFEAEANGQTTFINMRNYGGSDFGHGSWADYPWFGTDKFFFVEDNTMVGNGKTTTSGANDTENGGRRVFRHNYLINCTINDHGTEGGNRGHRATEIYDNTYDWTLGYSSVIRGGVYLVHGNKWVNQGGSGPNHNNMVIYRLNSGVTATTTYLPAVGDSPWDQNEGTLADGGVTTSASTLQGAQATLTDDTKNWTPNQWVGYSIKNSSQDPSNGKGSYIISNTATTITLYVYTSGDRGPTLAWSTGAGYQIRKVAICLDQLGRGKGELLKGQTPPLIADSNVQHWPNQNREPCFSWNNIGPNDTAYGFSTGIPTLKEGRDYYNLGKGLPEEQLPQQVKDAYPASINGVAFTHEFPYPHPLRASGLPTPNPNTPTPAPTVAPSTPAPTAAPSASPPPSGTTPPSSNIPAAPSNLAGNAGGVTLEWVDNATNETGYQVARSPMDAKNNCTGFAPLVSNLPPNTTTYRDITAQSGFSYCYRVRAEGKSGNFSPFSEIVKVTVP